MDTELLERLKELGLSEYEARAYLVLAKGSVISAEEVSERSEVPKGRIYDVLNSLSEKSLVRCDESRPKRYSAVDPETSVGRLLSSREKELSRKEKKYEEAADEAKDLLSRLGSDDSVESGSGFWTTAVHEENAKELLFERFSTAEDEILICASSGDTPREIQKKFVEKIYGILADGVDVRLITGEDDELVDLSLLIEEGLELRRIDDVPRQRFNVIDSSEACIEVLHPSDESEILSVINFRDGRVVDELHTTFESLWERGERERQGGTN
ncbi:MAG: helix-turn-helix domain-containing protein [Halobacteria archaeon]|nr:helix-turn-helix domain-containing protein [Halobacteria archaeon]